MPIKNARLREAGYRYYSFISYPNIGPMQRFARSVATAVSDELALVLPALKSRPPQPGASRYVFLDQTHIPAGAPWEPSLGTALCKSLTMIALCVPMYADQQHKFCGREWKTMQAATSLRFADPVQPIFVVRLRENLHPAIEAIQHYDLSKQNTLARLHLTSLFQDCVRRIREHIQRIAERASDGPVNALDCSAFTLDPQSAFPPSAPQPLPNRKAP
jgi:hypothetical protein